MRYLLQLLFITMILLVTSCASEVGDIDRTQPNKIKKSFFDGEWYMRDTIVDVPFNTAFTFIGEQTETSLIQWDIQEKYLIAYRTYEHNPGSEAYVQAQNNGIKNYGTVCSKDGDIKVLGYNQDCPNGYTLESKNAFQGTPVAAYAIKSHFDVQRQYNSSTGEQTNVIVENMSDRPWYKRDYVRVDFSKNLIPDFRFGAPNAIPQQGVNFYCSDIPKGVDPYCDRWAPIFDEENGYMSITTKILAQPETFDYYGTKYPTCYLNSAAYRDCLGQEITVKTDFMKKTDKQYAEKPVDYDEHKMQKFGFFRTEKYVYDRDRGFLEGAKKYYANVFDVFEKDENGEYTGKVNPIIYYVNKQFPEELWSTAKRIAEGKPTILAYSGDQVLRKGWNNVLMDVARATLGSKFVWNGPEDDIFIICHNPVRADDNPKCGYDASLPADKQLSPEAGDLRYNLIYWVTNPQASSPLGYGPLAADPLTGRTISANAFIYGNELEWYTQYVLELVDLVNGTTDVDDYISGRYISEYLRQKKDGEIHSNNITINTTPGHKFLDNKITVKSARKFAEAKLSNRIQGFKAAIKDKKMVGNHFQDRLNSLKGTDIEKSLETKDIRALINPSKDFVEGNSDISPLTWLSAKNLKREQELRRILAKKTIMMSDFNESSMLALAKYVADKITIDNWTREQAFLYIEEEIFYGTTIHEVGHNLGLRHNFAATNDTLNFFKQYWDIRIGDASQLDSTKGVQPMYLETKDRIKDMNQKGIMEYEYSSIMDYGGRANTDWQGLGRYDEAAIMFAYGDKIQVFDNDSAQFWKYRDKQVNIARDIYKNQHYSRILYDTDMHGGAIKLLGDKAAYVKNKEQNIDALYGHRKWVDWKTVLYTKDDPKVKDDPTLYLKDKANDDNGNPDGLVEVPYAFCSDEYHSGTYKCYRFDMGADMYESIINQEEYFDNWYFITNFKKGKSFFSENSNGYRRRIYGRLDFIANQFKHWVYEALIARDNQGWGLGNSARYYGEDLTVGALESFNFFTKVLGSIDPGFYTLNADNQYELTRKKDYLNNWDEQAQPGEIEIPLGVGKYQESAYDTSLGYNYYYTPVIQGVWYDKILAMFVLGDEHTNFMGVDASADMLSYAIAYTSIFTEDLMRTIAGIILDRPQYYAPFIYNNEYHNPIGLLFDKNALGSGLVNADVANANDSLYKEHSTEFNYIKVKNPFYVKYYAIVLGFAYFTDVTRFDFEKSMEINIVANGNSFIPTSFDDLEAPIRDTVISSFGGDEVTARAKWQDSTVAVVDPLSKRTYFAVNMYAKDTLSNDTLPKVSIGYELLKDFKVLSDNYNSAKVDYDATPNDSAKYEAFDNARKLLREKRDYIDLISKMMFYYKHPDY